MPAENINEKFERLETIAYRWIKKVCLTRIDKSFFQNEIVAHTDYPSLLALIDLLDESQFVYYAVRTELTSLPQFNYPLLAHCKNAVGEQGLKMVNSFEDWNTDLTLKKNWTGVVLAAGIGSDFINEGNILATAEKNKTRFSLTSVVMAIIIVFIACLWRLGNLLAGLWYSTAMTGFALSIAILTDELGVAGKVVKQFCGAVNPRGCGAVLRSKYAKVIGGISMGDFSLAYFGTQLIFLTLSCITSFPTFVLHTLLLLSVAGIVIILWSILTQLFFIRQWCALCLSIVIILLIQFLLAVCYFTFDMKKLWAVGPPVLFYFFCGRICLLFIAVDAIKKFMDKMGTGQASFTKIKKYGTK